MVRKNFGPNWAFGIKHSIEKKVEEIAPGDLHRWPLLKAFNFECHLWQERYAVIILRDKLSGPIAGGACYTLDDNEAPTDSPNQENLNQWQDYLEKKFSIRARDAFIIIPYVDSDVPDNQGGIERDWELWSDVEKQLWSIQIDWVVMRQFYYVKGIDVKGDFFVPPGYHSLADECARFFKDHPDYDKNVFIMTRFDPQQPLLKTLDQELKEALRSHGLNPVRADDKTYAGDRSLWNNVCVYMICCKYGIAILEDRIEDEFNPNVALEYGFIRALNKPTLLLADKGFRNLRADIIGTLREEFDITDIKNSIRAPIERWLRDLDLLNNN